MNVSEAIKARHSVSKWNPEAPHRALIEQLLEAATRAPNHFLTQPWRFWVLAGKAREEYGEVLAQRLKRHLNMVEPLTPEQEAALAAARAQPLRAPVIIAVGCARTENPKALPLEEIAAVAAAVENMLLLAEELGLGTAWRTGPVDEPEVKSFFGLGPEEHVVGLVYVGFPAGEGQQKPRAPFAEKTEWRGWE